MSLACRLGRSVQGDLQSLLDLPFGRPKSFNAEILSGLLGATPHDRPPLSAAWTIEELDPGFVVRTVRSGKTASLQGHGGDRESSAASHQRIIDVCADPSAASTSDSRRC